MSEDSDVYVIANTEGQWECVGYTRTPERFAVFASRRDIYNHLIEHYHSKEKVPNHALKRLVQEMNEEVDTIKAKWTPEQVEETLKELSVYFGEPVKPIGKYCDAFHTWQRAVEQGALRAAEGSYEKDSLTLMAQEIRRVSLHVEKSNLLARLLYEGEEIRSEPCPIHKGRWSGCSWGPDGCPHCMSGANVTGWVKPK